MPTIPQPQRFYPPAQMAIRASPRWGSPQVRPGTQGPGAGFAMPPAMRPSRGGIGGANQGMRPMGRPVPGKTHDSGHTELSKCSSKHVIDGFIAMGEVLYEMNA